MNGVVDDSRNPALPPIRVAVALGDSEREQRLLPGLCETGEIAVAERCLSGDDVLACVRRGGIDAVLLATDVHRATSITVQDVLRAGVATVVMAPAPDREEWAKSGATVVPLDSEPQAVRLALEELSGGRPPVPPEPVEITTRPEPLKVDAGDAEGALSDAVIAVVGPHGSPGRTTVALNLAAALGAVASAVVVEADVIAPSLAAKLDADPTHNLYMLAHADPETTREWDRALDQEAQPIHDRSRHGRVLCGVPKPEMREGLTPRFMERLLGELRQRYRYVIVDVGPELLGQGAVVHRAALRAADRILVVASADLVGLWRARVMLGQLESELNDSGRVALVINQHERRRHHSRTEIEWHLRVPAAAVIPADHKGMDRALAAQRPAVLLGHGRGARALLDLAERVHGEAILLPPEPQTPPARGWRSWPARVRTIHLAWPWPFRRKPAGEDANGAPATASRRSRLTAMHVAWPWTARQKSRGEEVGDGDSVAAVS